ncbi:uncharacterized protein LOC133832929 [Humulus lupulus]|uniref:uncharacterized protein LOC133832929 n=1 Tax=Humulus lupulus TaxID=3486 RepID=UPI002B40EFE9|nr:uncharacterized protein LOC133832929 [Humulus lupulus]
MVNQLATDVPWIVGMHVGQQHSEDEITWPISKDGKYSVKSGYRVAKAINKAQEGGSRGDYKEKWWKALWKLEVPPKVKIFWWKVCHKWIPAKVCLKRRGMDLNTTCSLCKIDEERVGHALWWCKLTKEFSKFVVVSWATWERRNKVEHGSYCAEGTALVDWALSLLSYDKTLCKINAQDKRNHTPIDMSTCRWKPHSSKEIHIKYDAAVYLEVPSFSISFVARNHLGVLVGHTGIWVPRYSSVEAAKARAILSTLDLAGSLQLSMFSIASDHQKVVNAIKNVGSYCTDFGVVILEIRSHCMFTSCASICHTPRLCNLAAHNVAVLSRKLRINQNSRKGGKKQWYESGSKKGEEYKLNLKDLQAIPCLIDTEVSVEAVDEATQRREEAEWPC